MTAKKLMKSLGVDEAAWEAFRREMDGNCVRAGMNVIITENWLRFNSGWRSALFPLREIEFFEKRHLSGRYQTVFFVALLFKNYKRYNLTCQFEELDAVVVALTERCPQANQRDYGTYL